MRVAIIPAYQASSTVGAVVRALGQGFDEVWVLDDGSTDGTGEEAQRAGARVLRHRENRGKGAALGSLLAEARGKGLDAVVSLDADGQHPAEEAIRMDREAEDRGALVLGVRDLEQANAPRANRRGNRIANYWIAGFAGRPLRDTQCGLRRYPVEATLGLGVKGSRFSFESEVVLRAVFRGMRVVEFPVGVRYPEDRTSHFRLVVDPARIIGATVRTLLEERGGAWFIREFARLSLKKS
jgi:glycosyltransferase involved in cell wall biosynthesis